MTFAAIIVVFIILASALWAVFFGGKLPQPFSERNCQGKGWRHAFPSTPKQEIREFLTIFVDAFAFSNKERLKLNPDDSIFQIYRALYPSKWTPDALELETLAIKIESKYGFKLKGIWHERLTLGELFTNIRHEPDAQPCAPPEPPSAAR